MRNSPGTKARSREGMRRLLLFRVYYRRLDCTLTVFTANWTQFFLLSSNNMGKLQRKTLFGITTTQIDAPF